MRVIAAFVALGACVPLIAPRVRAETVGEAAPITVSTALPSNITPGIPGISSNPTLGKAPAENPAPTPPEDRTGTDATADAVMQAAAPPAAPPKTAPAPVAAPAAVPAAAADTPDADAGKAASGDIQRIRIVRAALLKSFPQTPGAAGAAPTGGIAGLRVTSRDGKVILRGTVATQQLKDAAEARAASLVGGADNVDDRLNVQ